MKKNKSKQTKKDSSIKESVSKSLSVNEENLKLIIKNSIDIVYYTFTTSDDQKYLLVYLNNLINKEIVDRDVVGAIIKKAQENLINQSPSVEEYLKGL